MFPLTALVLTLSDQLTATVGGQHLSPQRSAPWHLDRTDQRDPENVSRYDFTYNFTNDGTGVRVYVVDSGIRSTHSEFDGRVIDGCNITNEYETIGCSGSWEDTDGHGTQAAALIAGETYGIAKNANLIAVRVAPSSGVEYEQNLVSAIHWINSQKDSLPSGTPILVSISVSTSECKRAHTCSGWPLLHDAIETSITEKHIPYIVTAGNGGENANACNDQPGDVVSAITVGATTYADAIADYSSRGNCIDLFAPGGLAEGILITTANYGSDEATIDVQGTSYATPIVAGVAAQYMQSHRRPDGSLPWPDDVMNAIVNNATEGAITNRHPGDPDRLLYSPLTAPASESPPSITRSSTVLTLHPGTWESILDPVETTYQWRYTSVYAGGEIDHPVCPEYSDGSGWTDVGGPGNIMSQVTTELQRCWTVTERKKNTATGDISEATSFPNQVDFLPPQNTSPPTITRSGNTLLMTDEGGWIPNGPVTTTYIWHWSHYTESSNGHGYCTSSYPGSGIWHDIISTQSSYAMTSTDAGRYCWALSVMKEKAGGGGGDVGTSEVLPVTFNVPTAQSIPTISRLGMTLSMTGASWSQVPDSLVTGYRWKSNNDQTCPVYPNGLWTNAGTATTQMITAAQRCWVVIETKTNPISGESVDATSSVFALPVPVISRSAPNGNWPVLSSDAVTWAGGSLDNVTYKWYLSGYRSGGIEACPVWGEGTWTQTGTAATQTTNDTQHCWVVLLKKTDPATGQYMEVASGVFHLKYLSPTAGPAPTISRSPVNGSSITLSASSGSWTLRDPVKATIVWERSYYSAPGMCSGATTWTTASIANLSYSGSAAISIPQQAAHFSQPCWRVSVLRENAGGGVSMASIYRIPFTAPVALSAPTITKLSSSALRGTPGTSGGDPGTLYYLWQWAPHAGSSYGHGYCPTASASSWQGSWVATWGGIPDQYMAPNQPCWKLTTFRANDAGTSAALSSSVLMAWG